MRSLDLKSVQIGLKVTEVDAMHISGDVKGNASTWTNLNPDHDKFS